MDSPEIPPNPEQEQPQALNRLVTRGEYITLKLKRDDELEAASSARQNLDNLAGSKTPVTLTRKFWNKRRVQTHDSKSQKLKEDLESVEEMFRLSNPDDTSGFYNFVAPRALSLGNPELADELIRLSERSVDQAQREYGLDIYSKYARMSEQIALFVGNKFTRPTLIKLDHSQRSVQSNPISRILEGDQYLKDRVDIDEVPEEVKYLHNLLGLEQFIPDLPNFTREAKWYEPERDYRSYFLTGLTDTTVFTFIFKRPFTKSVGPDAEMRYFPPAAALKLEKIPDDWPQPARSPEKQKVGLIPQNIFVPKLVPIPVY